MNTSIKKLIFLLIFTSFYSTYSFAALHDLSGDYTGTGTFTDGACTSDSSGTTSYNVTISGSNNSFSLSGDEGFIYTTGSLAGQSGTSPVDINITGTSNTTFSFTYAIGSPGATGSGNGTISDSQINFSGTFSYTGDPCSGPFTITLIRPSSSVVGSTTPSSTVTDTILFNTQVQGTVNNISTRINGAVSALRNVFRPTFSENQFKLDGALGLNAGDDSTIPYGVWGNYAFTDYENDLSSTAFNGTSHSFLGGIDFSVFDNTIIGIALGYDSSDIDTNFNNGNQDTNSFTIAPYFGAILNDLLSVDFNIGYSHVEYDQYRTSGTTRISSSPEADRWFGAFNMNATKFIDNWIIGARVGSLFASSTIDSYTESNNTTVSDSRTKVSTVSIAGDVAYGYGNYEPFLNLAYQYDFQLQEITASTGPQPSNDKDDILLTTGIRYFEKSGISGNLEYSKRLLRDDFDEDRISLTIRADF